MFYDEYWIRRTKRSSEGGFVVKNRDKIVWFVVPSTILRVLCSIFLRFYLIREIFIYQNLKKYGGSFILDMGCGEGSLFMGEFGSVFGVDIALQPLKKCKGKYNGVVCASALHLPFRDNCFDFVSSADLIGHIYVEDKPSLFCEMCRVLVVGGYSCHVVETDSSDKVYYYIKTHLEAYKKALFLIGGHVGLETCENTIRRFQEHFKLVCVEKAYSSILETEQIYILFKSCSRFNRDVNLISHLCEKSLKNFPIRLFLNIFLSMLSYIEIHFASYDKINGLLVTVKK